MLMRPSIRRLFPALAVTAVLISAFLAGGTAKLPNANLVASCGSYSYGVGSGPTPTVTGVDPSFGSTSGGQTVTITGSGFCNDTINVYFGSTPATSWVLVNDTTITAVTPAHAAGAVDVTVTTNGGTSPINRPGDLFNYLPDTPGQYHRRGPHRVLDTRGNGGRLGPNGDYVLQFGGVSVPANATAVIINVTVTNTSAASALIIYPTGDAQPNASNLNWVAGETVPNLVSVKLGTGGDITIHNLYGGVDVVVDLEGDFEPPTSGTAGEFVPLVPSRITDTRTSSGEPNAGSHLGPNGSLDIQVAGLGGVPPTGADSVVLNVTVTNTSTASALIVYPTGTTQPLASNLNWPAGKTVPNRVVVGLGTAGKVTVHNLYGSVDVVVDVNGYFTDGTLGGAKFFSLSPSRIADTRPGSGQGYAGMTIGPNGTLVVQVSDNGGVPDMSATDAPTAVILNVTVTTTSTASALIVYPDGTTQPLASDLNWVAGNTVPNLVVVKLGTNGEIDLHNLYGTVNVVIDVEGYFH